MATTREELLNDKLDYLQITKRIFKDVLTEQGVEISDEDTFRDYAEKIKTLNNGDVLLFETEQEMRNYDKPKEGVLAVIYNSYSDNIDDIHFGRSNYIRYIVFSKEITLTQECINNYGSPIRNSKGNYAGEVYLTPTSFYFFINGDINIEINYTSTDGINYTRVEDITNPIDVITPIAIEYYSSAQYNFFKQFMKYESGYFGGLYKYIDGVFVNVMNQFNLTSSNQLLTGYSAYGATGLITGDGSYITNMRTNEYVNKYLPNIKNNTFTAGIIQSGNSVKPMEFVQRNQLNSDEAFNTSFPEDDCIVQLADTRDVTINNQSQHKTIIQSYLNANTKYNYAFFIGDTAYRLYIGYNYSTKQQTDAEGVSHTVPYQMTSIYGFIVNLEDLSIYRTFKNTDRWTFTDGDFGNLLTYEYSIKSDCLVLLSDMDGWGTTAGAYMSITTISTTGARNTKYFTVNYSGDYSYKSIEYTSYDYDQDCYYLAYHTFQSRSEGGRGTTKRIVKITPTGTLSSIYTSSEHMYNIGSLWTNYFKNINSLICYTTDSKGSVLRNLANGNEVRLYGSTIGSSSYFGLDNENIYLSHKQSENDTNYNIYKFNMTTLEGTMIPETESTSRISNAFYTYNRDLCIYMNNKIISLQGEFLANFMKAMLNNPSISGIDKINEYIYRASFADYNLQISADSFTAKVPTYTYFRYSNITEFPITNDLCMVTPSISSSTTNDSGNYYKYQSLVITDIARSNEELLEELNNLQKIIDEANGQADTIKG